MLNPRTENVFLLTVKFAILKNGLFDRVNNVQEYYIQYHNSNQNIKKMHV